MNSGHCGRERNLKLCVFLLKCEEMYRRVHLFRKQYLFPTRMRVIAACQFEPKRGKTSRPPASVSFLPLLLVRSVDALLHPFTQ